MQKYIDSFISVSNDVYRVFYIAATRGANPELAFEQLRAKYKGNDLEEYVTEFSNLCEGELKEHKVNKEYLEESKEISKDICKMFKELVPKIFQGEMTDGDWNRIVQKTSSYGLSGKWKHADYYAAKYSSILAWELDRKNRRLRGIMTDDLTAYLESLRKE